MVLSAAPRLLRVINLRVWEVTQHLLVKTPPRWHVSDLGLHLNASKCQRHYMSPLTFDPPSSNHFTEAKTSRVGHHCSALKVVTVGRCLEPCFGELTTPPLATPEICYLIGKTFISTRWNRTHLDGGTLTPLFLCDDAIRLQTHAGAGQTVIPKKQKIDLFFGVCLCWLAWKGVCVSVCVSGCVRVWGADGMDCVSNWNDWVSAKL